jgi:hypothetical protein
LTGPPSELHPTLELTLARSSAWASKSTHWILVLCFDGFCKRCGESHTQCDPAFCSEMPLGSRLTFGGYTTSHARVSRPYQDTYRLHMPWAANPNVADCEQVAYLSACASLSTTHSQHEQPGSPFRSPESAIRCTVGIRK